MIPHYGPTEMLREAVLSVRGQDSARWRLHVVEDGLQDRRIGPWLQSLGDDRIHHHVNPETLGTAANFQRCLDLTTAEWVTFLGCDDLMEPGYVSAVLRSGADSSLVVAIHPMVRVIGIDGLQSRPLADRVKRRLTPPPGVYQRDELLASLLHGNWAYFPAIAWRREIISAIGFRADLPITLDLALLAEALFAGHQLAVLEEHGISYRRHAQSASSMAARDVTRFTEEAKLFAEIADRADDLGWSRSSRAARWHVTSRAHSVICAGQAIRAGDARSSARLLRHAFDWRSRSRRS